MNQDKIKILLAYTIVGHPLDNLHITGIGYFAWLHYFVDMKISQLLLFMFETACHGGVIGRLDTAWRVLGLSQVFIYMRCIQF